MPCGALRASLPQFLYCENAAAAPHSLPQSGNWVLVRPEVRPGQLPTLAIHSGKLYDMHS